MRLIPSTVALISTLLTYGNGFGQEVALVLDIGAEAMSEEYTFFRISDIAVDDEGRVVVVDAGDKAVKVYDANGSYLFKFGREGAGPGEFALPTSIRQVNRSWEVFDSRLGRVSRFGAAGEHLETVPLPTPAGHAVSRLVPLGSGRAIAVTVYRASPGSASHDPFIRAVLFDTARTSWVDTIASFEAPVGTWHVPGARAPFGLVELPWLGQGGAVATAGDSLILIADSRTGRAEVRSLRARDLPVVSEFDLGRRGQPADARRLNAIRDSLRASRRNPSIALDAPTHLSALTGRALFDSSARPWIELNAADPSGLWIYPATTGELREIRLPRAFQLKAVRGIYLYGVWVGEFDVQSVRIYRMLEQS